MPGTIVVRPTNGLCNRLSVISSFAALARRCDRELHVCWTSGPGWSDEDLDDLFESRFARVELDRFEQLCGDALCLHDQVAVTGVGGVNEAWRPVTGPGLAGVFDPDAHPVVTYAGFRRCQDLLPHEARRRLLPRFRGDFERELRSWRPVAEIRDRVADLTDGFGAQTIGVHVRRGDATAHPVVGDQYRRSSDRAFMVRINRIRRLSPQSSFFLATDSRQTEQLFRDRYGRAILTNPAKQFVPSILGAPKSNQRDAVIDLFALARTQRILGSYYSTFSRTAAVLADARLSVVVEDPPLARLRRYARLARFELTRRASTS